MLQLPLLNVEIGCNRFIEKIGAVAIKRPGQHIQSFYFVRVKPETDRLLIHIHLYYIILFHMYT